MVLKKEKVTNTKWITGKVRYQMILKLYVTVGLISAILTYAGMKFVEWMD